MGDLVISMLPHIIGSAVVPLQVILGIVFLKSPQQGLLKAIAYVAGMTTARLAQGLIFGSILAEAVSDANGGKSSVVAILLLVLGILLLLSAYKTWQNVPDSDDPPPKWLIRLEQATALKAFGIGLSLPLIAPKLWVFTLSALAIISAADLEPLASAIAYLLFILLAQSLLILPIVLRVLFPERSQALLAQLSLWLNQNTRPIVITVSLVFGLFFLYSGISGLLYP